MYSLTIVLIFSIAGILIGLLLGNISAQKRGVFSQKQAEVEKQLKELQDQQRDYQNDVTEHFTQTAQLLNQLTDSYKDVHQHLAEGAQLLAGADTSATIKKLTSDEETTETDHPVTPPLDYAPSTGLGTLSEGFGMEKPDVSEEKHTPADYHRVHA